MSSGSNPSTCGSAEKSVDCRTSASPSTLAPVSQRGASEHEKRADSISPVKYPRTRFPSSTFSPSRIDGAFDLARVVTTRFASTRWSERMDPSQPFQWSEKVTTGWFDTQRSSSIWTGCGPRSSTPVEVATRANLSPARIRSVRAKGCLLPRIPSNLEATVILEFIEVRQRPDVPDEGLERVGSGDRAATSDRVAVAGRNLQHRTLEQAPSVSPLLTDQVAADDYPGMHGLLVLLVDDGVAFLRIAPADARQDAGIKEVPHELGASEEGSSCAAPKMLRLPGDPDVRGRPEQPRRVDEAGVLRLLGDPLPGGLHRVGVPPRDVQQLRDLLFRRQTRTALEFGPQQIVASHGCLGRSFRCRGLRQVHVPEEHAQRRRHPGRQASHCGRRALGRGGRAVPGAELAAQLGDAVDQGS